MAVDLGTAFGRIVLDARGATTGAAAASRAFSGIGKSAAVGIGAIALGFSAAVGLSVNAAAEFEQGLSSVAAVSDATAGELAQLREQALKVAQATKFSPDEAVAGQRELAKAGVDVADILGGALPGALALAAAGDVEVADAASYAANAMNLFGLAGKDVTGIADAFATAANTTTADVADFGMALTQGGAAAKLAGLDFLQTMTFLEGLAKAGVRGSDAGTSLKTALIQLLNPTAKQAALADKLGLSFVGQNGKLKDAATISADLRRATLKMNDAQRAQTFAVLAGTDGLRVLSSLYAAGPATLSRYARELGRQGTAADTARKRQDNLKGALEQLGGAVDTLKIKLGTAAIPVLRDLAEAAVEGINALTESDSLQAGLDRFSSGFEGAVDTARRVGGELLPVLQQLAGVAGDTFDAIGNAGAGAAPVLTTLATGAFTLAGAVVALVAPIASLVAALTSLPGVTQTAASALVGLGAALLVLRIAPIAIAAVQSAGAFLTLAASVRTAGSAAALAGAAFPRLAAGLAVLGGPVGIAAAGIGLVTAGVVALASGMFRGASPAEQLAAAMRNVDAAAKGAAGAVRDLKAATDTLQDVNLRAQEATLRVAQAEAELARVRRDPGASPLDIRQAELALARARLDANRATRDRSAAETEAARKAKDGVVALAELATEQGRATDKAEAAANVAAALSGRFGVSGKEARRLTSELAGLTSGSTTTAARMTALQGAARKAATQIQGTGPVAREARAQLEAIANANPGQLRRFAQSINQGVADGKSRAQAGKDAIEALLQEVGTGSTADLSSLIASIQSQGALAIAAAAAVAAGVRSQLAKANADTRSSPSANDRLRTSMDRMAGIAKAGHVQVANETRRGVDSILAEEATLSARLDRMQAAWDAQDAARDRRRLVNRREQAARELARANAEERAGARESLAQARRDLAEFDREAARTKARRPLEARRDAIAQVSSAIGGVESALSDVSSRIGDAIDRGLQASLDGIDARLRDALSAIDASQEAQRADAIGTELDTRRRAREDRDAAKRTADANRDLASAQEVTARRQAALARARTESERQAATELLRQAQEAEAAAAEAANDAAEDQNTLELERERDHLGDLLQARRDAANAQAEAERAAAQAAADAQKAQLDRQLGDLAENLRDRKITYRQFVEGVRAITGDPALAADLERSGRELGLSFSRGLERSIRGAEGAAEAMAKAIAKYLRLRSPAEAGPLAHDFRRSGAVIGTDLARGMARTASVVGAQARALAAQAALAGANRGPDRGAGPAAGAATGGGDTYHVTVDRGMSPLELAARLGWEKRMGGR